MLIPHQKPTPKFRDVFFGACNYLIRRKTNLKYLKKYLPDGNIYWTSSGRNALYWILKNEGIKEVYLPSFTCHVVLDAIKRNNCKVEFIDSEHLINIDNFIKILKEKKENIKKALVLPYNFGFLPDIEGIVKICKENNIMLIEDCAQALGAEYKGKLVGNFGEYAFFSFGISKNIGFGNGLIVSKKEINIDEKKKYPIKKTLINIIQSLISQSYFHPFFYPIFYNNLKKKIKNDKKYQELLDFKASELGKYIIMQQAKRYDEILRLRRENAEHCINKLSRIIDFIKPEKNTNPGWLYFVIKSKNRKELGEELFKEKVDLQPLLTFKDLNKGKLASKFEKEHLSFALYRNKLEIEFIIKKIIKKWK